MGIRNRNMDEFTFPIILDGVAGVAATEMALTAAATPGLFIAPFDCRVRLRAYVQVEDVTGGGPAVFAVTNNSASAVKVTGDGVSLGGAALAVGDEWACDEGSLDVHKGDHLQFTISAGALTGGTPLVDLTGWLICRRIGPREDF
jgi:hypothetical protein